MIDACLRNRLLPIDPRARLTLGWARVGVVIWGALLVACDRHTARETETGQLPVTQSTKATRRPRSSCYVISYRRDSRAKTIYLLLALTSRPTPASAALEQAEKASSLDELVSNIIRLPEEAEVHLGRRRYFVDPDNRLHELSKEDIATITEKLKQ